MALKLCTRVDIMDLVSTFSPLNSQDIDNYFLTFDIYQRQYTKCDTCMCGAIDDYDIFDIIFRQEQSKIKEILNYCFSKRYILKDDVDFQERIADIVCDINHWAGICSDRDSHVFFWSIFNILTHDTLLDYRKTDDEGDEYETVFHQLFHSNYKLSDNYMRAMFLLFDKIKFDYNVTGMRPLIISATYAYDVYSINELLKRGLSVDIKEMTECLTNLIKRDLVPLKNHYNYENKFLLNYIYNDPELITEIFKDVNTEAKYGTVIYDEDDRDVEYLDKNIINKLMNIMRKQPEYYEYEYEDYDEKEIFYDILSLSNRRSLVRPLNALQSIYDLFLKIKQNGYNMRKVADRYFNGCVPIKILEPDMHLKFHALFTN